MAGKYPFLDFKLEKLYEAHLAGWERDEARLYGGDAVLPELVQWVGESATFYTGRQGQTGFPTFPKIQASTLTGHESKQTPMPDFAQLGTVRERKDIDTPSLAEILNYNVDGIGQDGTELLPWFDGVQERAIATGYRWVMAETPTVAQLVDLRVMRGAPPGNTTVTLEDVIGGFHPYAVEYSPIQVPYWQMASGRLDFAVIRVPVVPESLLGEDGSPKKDEDGYYLLVRRGFRGLGTEWAEGGWWKFDPEQDQIPDGRGLWDKTNGQIPLFQFVGEPSTGTTRRPAIGRSLTMELGQIAVSLMNRMSERNYNVSQAAKSINWILGIGASQHAEALAQLKDGSIVVGVPPVMYDDGNVGIPTMWNSSAAALDVGVFKEVIEGGFAEAREIMVKQVSSEPGSSGESKVAGFGEATSPLLTRLATTRQQGLNTFLYFASLRFGIPNPRAEVKIPRDFDLQPVVDDIDAMMNTLKRSWLRSPTLEKHLLVLAADERGLMPEDGAQRTKVENELTESGKVVPTPMDQLGGAAA